MTTVPIIASKGKAREKFAKEAASFDSHYLYRKAWKEWYDNHPPLPVFTPNGEPFLDDGEYEAELVWQYYDVVRDCWDEGVTSSAEHYKGCDTRQIYRLIKPIKSIQAQERKEQPGVDRLIDKMAHTLYQEAEPDDDHVSGLDLNKLEKEVDNLIASSTAESYNKAFAEIDAEAVQKGNEQAEFKGTPGPWKFRIDPTKTGFYIETVDMSHNKTFIAEVGGGLQSMTEVGKNAHLIASAPELLEALQKIVNYLDGNQFHKISPNTPLHFEAKAAIKKALNQPI